MASQGKDREEIAMEEGGGGSTPGVSEVVANPFKGSGLLRSPLRRNSDPCVGTSCFTGSDSGSTRKRKKVENGVQEDATDCEYFWNELGVILKDLKEINRMTSVHPTTHTEIKVAVKKVQARALRLLTRGPREEPTQPKGSRVSEKAPVMSVSIGVQTLEADTVDEELRTCHIRNRIKDVRSSSEVAELVKEDWPMRVFENTKRVNQSILRKSKARAVVIGNNNQKDLTVLQQLEVQFPAIGRLNELKAGRVAVIFNADRVIMEEGEERANDLERMLIVGKVENPQDRIEVADVVGRIAREVAKQGHKEISVYVSEGLEPMTALKIVECFMAQNELKAELCNKAKQQRERIEGKVAAPPKSVYQVTVRGNTYADMLKSLKEHANPDDAGVIVQGASRTSDGNLRLRIKETREGGGVAFRQQIAEQVKLTAEVRSGRPGMAVIIRDLDETTTKEEIERSLKVNLKGGEAEARIGDIRFGLMGRGSVVVRLPRDSGKVLLGLGRIQVGWSSCRVSEPVGPQRCHNCLGTGHFAFNCGAPKAKGKRCYRCGSDDHLARECTSTEQCFICKVKGHFTNSMECPVYRKQVEESKASRSQAEKGDCRGQRLQ